MWKEIIDYLVALFKGNVAELETEMVEEEKQLIIHAYRDYHEHGTHTELVLPNGEVFYCLENPWLHNEPYESCIPEGLYELRFRDSEVVTRTSGGQYHRGYQVIDVPNRTFIMFHVGNYVEDTDGCVLVGSSFDFDHIDGVTQPVVWSSMKAFEKFMEAMLQYDVEELCISFEKREEVA